MFDETDAVTVIRSAPELNPSSALIGGTLDGAECLLELDRCVGLREVYWRVCITCYLLACVAPRTFGAYLWQHVPAVNSLMLMSMSERYFYPPAFADAKGSMQQNIDRMASGALCDPLPAAFEKHENMISHCTTVKDGSSEITDGNTARIDVRALVEEASQLCPIARTLAGVYDVDRFILQEEKFLWNTIFRPRPKPDPNNITPTLDPVKQPKCEMLSSLSKGKRSRPLESLSEADKESTGAREVKKSRVSSPPAKAPSALTVDVSSATMNARRSTRQRVNRFDIKAMVGTDTDDESSSSSEDEDSREARRSRKRRVSTAFVRPQRAAPVKQFLQSVTRWGIPDSSEIVFLPLQVLCRVPPVDIIKCVQSWNTKYRFGAQLRQSVDPDFIADVTGGSASIGKQLSVRHSVSSREDVLQSIGWLVPAIVADINNILGRIPMVACVHILLVTLMNISQKLAHYMVLGGPEEVVDILENTSLGEDVAKKNEVVKKLQRVRCRDATHAQMLGSMMVSTGHQQDVILCRGLVAKVMVLLRENLDCSPADIIAIRQQCFLQEKAIQSEVPYSEFVSVMVPLIRELCHTTVSRREVGKTALHLLFNALQGSQESAQDFDVSLFFSLFASSKSNDQSGGEGLSNIMGDILCTVAGLDSPFSYKMQLWNSLSPIESGASTSYHYIAETSQAKIASQLVVSMTNTHISVKELPGLRQVVSWLLDMIDSRQNFGWIIYSGSQSPNESDLAKIVSYNDCNVRIEVLILCGLCAALSAQQMSSTPTDFSSDSITQKSLLLFASVTSSMSFTRIESLCLKPFLEMGKVESPAMCEVLLKDFALRHLAALVMKYAFPLPFVVNVLNSIEVHGDLVELSQFLNEPCDFVKDLLMLCRQLSKKRTGDNCVEIFPGWRCWNDWRRLLDGITFSNETATDAVTDKEDDAETRGLENCASGGGVTGGWTKGALGGAEDTSKTVPYDISYLDVFLLSVQRGNFIAAAENLGLVIHNVKSQDNIVNVLTDIFQRMCCSCSLQECFMGLDITLQCVARRFNDSIALILSRTALHVPLALSLSLVAWSSASVEGVRHNLAQVSSRLCAKISFLSCDDMLSAWGPFYADFRGLISRKTLSGSKAHFNTVLMSIVTTTLQKLWDNIQLRTLRTGVEAMAGHSKRSNDCILSTAFIGDLIWIVAHADDYTNGREMERTGRREFEYMIGLMCRISSSGEPIIIHIYHLVYNEHLAHLAVSDKTFASSFGPLAMPHLLQFPCAESRNVSSSSTDIATEAISEPHQVSRDGLLWVRRVLFGAYLSFPEVSSSAF